MPQITNGTITFEQDYLDWFTERYGATEWAVYVAGVDEVVTHDMQNTGDEPHGEPFTEDSAREYLAEMNARFGPGSPMDLATSGDPLYAVALHYGVPAFGSHDHRYSFLPPDGTFDKPGDCACGATYADHVKALDDRVAATEWAVWVAGLGVLTRQDIELDDDDPANPPFTEESARQYAAWVKTEMAPIRRGEANGAVVLHYGVPEAAEAKATAE